MLKFRGMDANGVMRYGRLSQDKPNSTAYYEEYSQRICWDYSNIPVTNKSLGWALGINDKNDKEIFKGDIIKYRHMTNDRQDFTDRSYEVYWDYVHAKFMGVVYGYSLEPGLFYDAEIIGNIHEHPHLIDNT